MLKSQDEGLSRTWSVRKRHAGFYTGGKVQLAHSGAFFACMYEGSVSIVRAADGVLVKRISPPQAEEGGEQFSCFVLHPNDRDLVTVSQNQMLRHWDARSGQCKRAFKVHAAPVLAMGMDPTGTLVATGSADRTCKVWDLEKGFCTHSFAGHAGSIKVVEFHPDPHRLLLVTGGDDCHVRVWDLASSSCAAHFTQHVATVTAVAFSPSGWTLLTAGRDKVVNVFSLRSNQHLSTVLVHEGLEAVATLPAAQGEAAASAHGGPPADKAAADHVYFATFGERGRVRVWRLTSRVESVVGEDGDEGQALRLEGIQVAEEAGRHTPCRGTHLFFAAPTAHVWGGGGGGSKAGPGEPRLLAVNEDHHFLRLALPSLRREAQLVGFNDDIIDAVFVPGSWSHTGALPEDGSSGDKAAGAGADSAHSLSGVAADGGSGGRSRKRAAVKRLPAPTGLLAFASNSPAVRLMDVSSFSCDLLSGHRDIVLAVDVSPDGRWLATASKDNSARVWCLRTRKCVATLAGHTGSVSALAFSRKPGAYAAVYARAAGIRRKLKHREEQAQAARRKTGKAAEHRARVAEEAQAAIAALGRDAAGGAGARSSTVGVVSQGATDGPFLVTASDDKTVKLWSLAELCAVYDEASEEMVSLVAGSDGMMHPSAHLNVLAHAKGVNDTAVAPNDRMFATASQDRTVKLWSPDALHLLGELKGHRRGVWAVAFSPVDRVAATASGDRTVKLWSVVDMSCLRTFEGHTATVLRVQFVTSGLQLLSSGADGLMKLWTVRTNECANTFDAHSDKAWALAVRGDGKQVVTGGSDSVLNVWQDCTHQEVESAVREKERLLLLEQDLLNAIRGKQYRKAISLAFELDQPMRLLSIFESLIGAVLADEVEAEAEARLAYGREGLGVLPPGEDEVEELAQELRGGSCTARDVEAQRRGESLAQEALSRPLETPAPAALREALIALTPKQLSKCMHYVREWNTNAKHAFVAQTVYRLMVEIWPLQSLLRTRDMPKVLDAFGSYTKRHFQRTDRLVQSSYLVDYALAGMRHLLPEPGAEEAEGGTAPDRASLDMLAAHRLRFPPGGPQSRPAPLLHHGGWHDAEAGGDASAHREEQQEEQEEAAASRPQGSSDGETGEGGADSAASTSPSARPRRAKRVRATGDSGPGSAASKKRRRAMRRRQ